jgi:hypothetical protein
LPIDDSQSHECELAGVARPPQPVEWYIGYAISFQIPFGNVLKRCLIDRRWGWGGCFGSSPRFFELRILEWNRQMIRASNTGDPELKIRWTIGSQAAFLPFGGTPNQLNQDVVTDVRLDV